jgi:uncharacterized protein
MKYLIWLVVAAVVGLWWSSARRRARDRRGDSGPLAPVPPPPPPQADMVACAHCGVHLPAAEALTRGALAYCCGAHADAGPRPPGA